jgi:hypothetical protein
MLARTIAVSRASSRAKPRGNPTRPVGGSDSTGRRLHSRYRVVVDSLAFNSRSEGVENITL